MAARPGTLCYCGYQASRQAVRREDSTNKGRYFFGCKYWPKRCNFFAWETAQELPNTNAGEPAPASSGFRQHAASACDKELATVLQRCLCVGEGSQQGLQRLTQQYPSQVLHVLQTILAVTRPELHSVLAQARQNFKTPSEAADHLLATLKASELVRPETEAAAQGVKRTVDGAEKMTEDADYLEPTSSLFNVHISDREDDPQVIESLCGSDVHPIPRAEQQRQQQQQEQQQQQQYVVVRCRPSNFMAQLEPITKAFNGLSIGPYKFAGWVRCICEECWEHHAGNGPHLLVRVQGYTPGDESATVAEQSLIYDDVEQVEAGGKEDWLSAGVFVHVYEDRRIFKLSLELREGCPWSGS